MDANTINTTNIFVKQGATNVSGVVNYSEKVATFTPDADFASETVYTVTVGTGVKDASGNALATEYTYNFTTGDFIAPSVSSKSPDNGAISVALNSNISVTFSEDMSAGSITTSSFKVNNGALDIAGGITYNNKVATFDPSSDLEYGKTYTVTLSTAIQDDMGNPLSSQVQWTFTTIYPPQFGDGSDGEIVITSGAGTVNIRDLYENNSVTGVIVNGVSNKGLGHCDSCNGGGTTNYDPQNGRFIKAKSFTIEAGITLTADAFYDGTDNKKGIIWIAVAGTFNNYGTINMNGKGGQGGPYISGHAGAGFGAGAPGVGVGAGKRDTNAGTQPGGIFYGNPTIGIPGVLSDSQQWVNLYGSGGGAVRIYAVNGSNIGNILTDGVKGVDGPYCGTGVDSAGGGGSGGTIYIEIYLNNIGLGTISSIGGSGSIIGKCSETGAMFGSGAGHVNQGGPGRTFICHDEHNVGSVGRIAIKVPAGVTITGTTNPGYYDITQGAYH